MDKNKYINVSEDGLIDLGIDLWHNAISKQFNYNEKHVVPLSGGLDSRAILGSLLKFTNAQNINTYTFGTPGTLDYNIGNYIAKKIGTKHTNFPLNNYKYDLKDLINISKRIDYQTLLFLHPPVSEVDKLFTDFNVWSGAIIDVFFGRHSHIEKANNWRDAIRNSFKENIFTTSIELTNIVEEDFFKYINIDNKLDEDLVLEHVIDLLNRQLKYIAPHVLMQGYKYKTLLDNDLVNFALSLKNELLENQYIYIKMLLKEFPYLFSFPTKTNMGLPLMAKKYQILRRKAIKGVKYIVNKVNKIFPNEEINYIDFDDGIRNKPDLKKIIYESIMDLKKRKIVDWIDIDGIWKRHQTRQCNHADALITLASLEIHLKAGKKL